MHPDLKYATKYMKPILIGELEKPSKQTPEVSLPLFLRLSVELLLLLGLICGVMSRQNFPHLAIVACSYICGYRH